LLQKSFSLFFSGKTDFFEILHFLDIKDSRDRISHPTALL